MAGPITPIIKAMAAYYAKRTGLEYDDLYQEGWLGVLRPHHCPLPQAAWSAITNYVAQQKSWRRHLQLLPRSERVYNRQDARLDAPVYLAKAGDPIDRLIIKYRFWHYLSDKQIAARLKISRSSVYRRSIKAIERMQIT